MKMKATKISVDNSLGSLTKPYIYFIYIIDDGVAYLYIGETTSNLGAIGRLAYHLQYANRLYGKYYQGATFIKNLFNKTYFYDTNQVKNINMIAYDISEYGNFEGDLYYENRRAIEYLVQSLMLQKSADTDVKIPFEIISEVTENSYTDRTEYKTIAKKIFDSAICELSFW